jgi:uroporphyrinogen decarboxylase
MTPRERVLRSFGVFPGRPDRVPLQFDLCESLLAHFSRELDIPLNITRNLYEDVSWRISGNEVRVALGSEIVVTGTSEAADYRPDYLPDGRWHNEYGMTMKPGELYTEVDEYPLAEVETASDIRSFSLPDLSRPGRFDDVDSLVARYHDEFVVIGGMGVTIMSLIQQLAGIEKLMMDMALGAEYLPPLIDMVTDFQIEQARRLIDHGVDGIFVGDDFGGQTSLLFSRQMFLDYWKSSYVRFCSAVKEKKPDATLVLHSDGAITPILDDIHEIGFEVLNPIQPGVPQQSAKQMRDNWSNKFAFWGGLDEQYLIPEAPLEELDATIAQIMKTLGSTGRYVAAPAHILQPDVSPERVHALIESCRRHCVL